MKRLIGLAGLLLVALALAYAAAVASREAAYEEHIRQGDAALARDDSFAAIEAFTLAIALKGDSMAAHLKRGEAYRRRGEGEAALRDLRRAADLDPLAPHPRELLGDVNAMLGRHARAAERYREYLALDDRSPRVLYKLALSLLSLGQVPAATATLRQTLALDDRFAAAHYLLAVCLRELQRPADALPSLERAIALDPALLAAREELADLYGRLERHADRNRQLEALAALDPGARREVALALGYVRDGQIERAVLRLGNATRHFPGDPQTYAALGRLWLERAERGGHVELSKALGALETAALGDSSSAVHTLYGRALMLAGDLARAEQALAHATSRFPVDAMAFYYLAEVAERRGQPAVARQALADYTVLEGPGSPRVTATVLARLASAHLRAGDPAAARQALERAKQKDPSHPDVRAVAARVR